MALSYSRDHDPKPQVKESITCFVCNSCIMHHDINMAVCIPAALLSCLCSLGIFVVFLSFLWEGDACTDAGFCGLGNAHEKRTLCMQLPRRNHGFQAALVAPYARLAPACPESNKWAWSRIGQSWSPGVRWGETECRPHTLLPQRQSH